MLTVHRSYLGSLRPLLSRVHAMAHITGGGLPGNLNRALPATLDAIVETATWSVPNVFEQLQRAGGVERDEMFRTFNMGVGMVVILAESYADDAVAHLNAAGGRAWRVGRVARGSGRVILN